MKTVKKAIMPVAGFGTRFLPATKAQPKEMLPIVDKPVIQYLVEEAAASGIQEIIFVTGRNKRAIEDHFDYAPDLELLLKSGGKDHLYKEAREISNLAKFAYVRQKEPRGNGDALLNARHLINGEPVAIMFGDDIVRSQVPCLLQLMKVFDKYQDVVIALEEIDKKEVSQYGVVRATKIEKNLYEIKDIVEKPKISEAPSNLTIVGKYIVTPEFFDVLSKIKKESHQELGITDGLRSYLKKRPIYGYKFEGKRYDCGSKLGFLKAIIDFSLEHKELGNEFKNYLRNKIRV